MPVYDFKYQEKPRSHLHSSSLIRFFSDLALVNAVEPGNAFAEKLGLWLDFTDAITLRAAHDASIANTPSTPSEARSAAGGAVGAQLARVRATLANSISKSCSPQGGKTRLEWPTSQPGEPVDLGQAYEPYRRSYFAHQRDMDLSIRPLRAHVREVLAKASPPLKRLAALDAALDGILRERESQLLATVPALLRKRFEQLLTAHQQGLADTQQADNPTLWMQAGAWLARFSQEWQTVLLAELDLRLQPTVGLMEALNNEITQDT